MRVLIAQFSNPTQETAPPVFSHNIGVLCSRLKSENFTVSLVDLKGYQPQRLRQKIVETRPQYVLVDMSIINSAAARRTIADIAWQFALPVAVMGQYPTCDTSRAVSIPGVVALFVGEYEHTAVEYLCGVRRHGDPAGIDGLWINTPDGLVKGSSRKPQEDLDALPFPDRDVFDYQQIVQHSQQACFKVARGCPRWCGHCVSDIYADLYDSHPVVRRRSVPNVVEEVRQVIATYEGIKRVVFHDHAFACDLSWLREFAAQYVSCCNLPYTCYVPLEDVSGELVKLLSSSRCTQVNTTIGSGSRFIRDEIQAIHVSNEQIVNGCGLLRQAGIEIHATVYIGLPYETEISIDDTLELLANADIRHVYPQVYYPLPGTRSAEVCRDNGWISGRSADHYWQNKSVLDMPSLPARQINELAQKFPAMLKRRRGGMIRRILRSLLGTSPRR